VYWVTLDAHLLALDAKTGKVLWDATVGDYTNAEALTVAPLVVKGKVIVGISGAEYGVRGFIDAYDANTGERVWRFYTVPAKDEPGGETWEGDSWMTGGGSAWVTGSYDPELNLIYWGTGNPAPDWNGEVREGDNLYTDSIVALDADTGKLVWYFQNTPHDVWDWDGVSEPILVDLPINGKMTKALLQVNRNGFFYALDRTNGKFLFAKPYCQATWLEKMDENGRPTPKKEALTSEEGVWVCPGVPGGKNWPPTAYNPQTNLVYAPVIEECGKYTSSKVFYRKGLPYLGSGMTRDETKDERWGHVTAIEASTGNIAWQYKTQYPMWAGMLTIAGGLVFSGDPEGNFFALDAKTGERLWSFQTGSGIHASPITYMLDGKQYIAIASGWEFEPKKTKIRDGDTLYVFGLFEE
jgi:alcohol dehydrogenase (cytochrome c)